MAKSYFRVNPNARRLLNRQLQEHTDSLAEKKANAAQQIAPVDTGDYQASIHAEPDPADKARTLVVAGTDHWPFVEARENVLGKALNI